MNGFFSVAEIKTVDLASLKQGIPNFILLALSEEQSQLVATERQCFPYQSIKVKKGRKKTGNLYLHTQDSSEKKLKDQQGQ